MSNNTLFDTYIMVDWSAKDEPGPQNRKDGKLKKDNIWIGEAKRLDGGLSFSQTYCRTRARAYHHLEVCLKDHLKAEKRILIGFDFAFGYPAGFAEALTGKAEWKGVWEYLTEHLEDDELNENNRFELADKINGAFKEDGPFWGVAKGVDLENIGAKSPWKGVDELKLNGKTICRLRHTDRNTGGAQEVWKLYGAGSVGSQTLTGIPVVWKLRCHKDLQKDSLIWPFETMMLEKEVLAKEAKVIFAEIFPSQVSDRVKELGRDREANGNKPKDQLQVWAMTEALGQADESGELMNWFVEAAALPKVIRSEEAAILQAPAPLEETPKKKEKVKKERVSKSAGKKPKDKKVKSDPVTKSREIEKRKNEKKKKQEEARQAREKKKEEIKKKREAEISKRKEEREKERAKLIEAKNKAKEEKKKEREARLEKLKVEKEAAKAQKEKERQERKESEKAKKEEEKKAKLAKVEAAKNRKAIEEEREKRRQEEKLKAAAEAKAAAEKKAKEEAKVREAGSMKRHVSPEVGVVEAKKDDSEE